MKIILLISILSFSFFSQAQKIDFSTINNSWKMTIDYHCPLGVTSSKTEVILKKDTIISGKKYAMLFDNYGKNLKKYVRFDSTKNMVYARIDTSPEFILYKFEMKVGDTIDYAYTDKFSDYMQLRCIDIIAPTIIKGIAHNTMRVQYKIEAPLGGSLFFFNSVVVEGLGDIKHPFSLGSKKVDTASHCNIDYNVYCFTSRGEVLPPFPADTVLLNVDCSDIDTGSNIHNSHLNNLISLYPNPVNRNLIIDALESKLVYYEVYNTLGQLILSGKMDKNMVNTESLLKGIYMIQITDNDGRTYHHKFVKK